MSLFKFCQTGKVLLKSPKQAEGSSQAPYKTDKGQPVAHKTAFLEEATLFDLEKEKKKTKKQILASSCSLAAMEVTYPAKRLSLPS